MNKSKQMNVRITETEFQAVTDEANTKGITVSELVREKLFDTQLVSHRNKMNATSLVRIECYLRDAGWDSLKQVTAYVPASEVPKVNAAFPPGERVSVAKLLKHQVDIRKIEDGWR